MILEAPTTTANRSGVNKEKRDTHTGTHAPFFFDIFGKIALSPPENSWSGQFR